MLTMKMQKSPPSRARLQEMAAMREETRALTATLTRVAEKVEAIAQFERDPGWIGR